MSAHGKNYKLTFRIIYFFGDQRKFAQTIGETELDVSQTIHGRRKMKPAEITLWKEALGYDDGLLGSVVTVSNFIVFYSDVNFGPGDCNLGTKFEFSTMAVGAYNYTEHDYMITGGVPDIMIRRKLLRISNDERDNNASSDYIRFTNQVS